jgi:hypothetical protein
LKKVRFVQSIEAREKEKVGNWSVMRERVISPCKSEFQIRSLIFGLVRIYLFLSISAPPVSIPWLALEQDYRLFFLWVLEEGSWQEASGN